MPVRRADTPTANSSRRLGRSPNALKLSVIDCGPVNLAGRRVYTRPPTLWGLNPVGAHLINPAHGYLVPDRRGDGAARAPRANVPTCPSPDGLIIIVIVVPRSRVVAEMKPYARRNGHADARTMVA